MWAEQGRGNPEADEHLSENVPLPSSVIRASGHLVTGHRSHTVRSTTGTERAQPSQQPLPSRLPHIGLPGKEMSKCLSVRYRSKHLEPVGWRMSHRRSASPLTAGAYMDI